MHVADLELCKQLYEISRWETSLTWAGYKSYDDTVNTFLVSSDAPELGHDIWRVAYAYDLGYLLRELPKWYQKAEMWINHDGTLWTVGYASDEYSDTLTFGIAEMAETPEDAACRLAIELFKQGILANTQPNNAVKPPIKDEE